MQSTDSLRELNAKLLAEIAELRKKFVEIESENSELKNENAKLRQIIEENARRDAENAEYKVRLTS
jgi:regulator of replication initiation timing